MSMTPEGKVKHSVKKMLEQFGRFGLYQYWPVPAGYGPSSLDCLICFYGQFIAVETKAPGKKATPRQLKCLEEIQAASGSTFVISDEAGVRALEVHLKHVLTALYKPEA